MTQFDRVWLAVRWIVSALGVAYPLASDHVGALKSVLPIVGSAWTYSAVGIVAGIIVSVQRQLVRNVEGRWIVVVQIVLPILAVAALFSYHILWMATSENAATWVYQVFPWLYGVVVLFVSLSVSWLKRV